MVEEKNNSDYYYMHCEICGTQGLCRACTLETNNGDVCQGCKGTWACEQCVLNGKKWNKCHWCGLC